MKALEQARKVVDKWKSEGLSPTLYDIQLMLNEIERLTEERTTLIIAKRELEMELRNSPRWEEIAKTEHGELAQLFRDMTYTVKRLSPVILPGDVVPSGQPVRAW